MREEGLHHARTTKTSDSNAGTASMDTQKTMPKPAAAGTLSQPRKNAGRASGLRSKLVVAGRARIASVASSLRKPAGPAPRPRTIKSSAKVGTVSRAAAREAVEAVIRSR
jgi:hypothetical protein